MNSRRLQNSHQRHKFLRAKASREVSEMSFPGGFKRYFPPWMPCCFVRIHARLGTMPSKCPRRSTTSHSLNVLNTDVNLFKYSFDVIQTWEMDVLQFYLMVLIFLLAVMVEGGESSRLRMANQPAVLAGYWPSQCLFDSPENFCGNTCMYQ